MGFVPHDRQSTQARPIISVSAAGTLAFLFCFYAVLLVRPRVAEETASDSRLRGTWNERESKIQDVSEMLRNVYFGPCRGSYPWDKAKFSSKSPDCRGWRGFPERERSAIYMSHRAQKSQQSRTTREVQRQLLFETELNHILPLPIIAEAGGILPRERESASEKRHAPRTGACLTGKSRRPR